MTTSYYQQGDVLLKRIESLPKGLTRTENLVLQEGETTGHKHQFRIVGQEVEVYYNSTKLLHNGETIMPGNQKFVIVKDEVQLLHEEHQPITVAPGIYEMDLVREYDYDKHEVRRVVD